MDEPCTQHNGKHIDEDSNGVAKKAGDLSEYFLSHREIRADVEHIYFSKGRKYNIAQCGN